MNVWVLKCLEMASTFQGLLTQREVIPYSYLAGISSNRDDQMSGQEARQAHTEACDMNTPKDKGQQLASPGLLTFKFIAYAFIIFFFDEDLSEMDWGLSNAPVLKVPCPWSVF